jgi:hypothetical protein
MDRGKKPGEKLQLQPQQADCRWVKPQQPGVYFSPSDTFSMLALITCVTTNIPMKAIFRAWWTFINTVAKPAYNKYAGKLIPIRVAKMWEDLKAQSDICYRIRNVNYLHTIFEFNGCQCSCGTAMLFDIMASIDPNVKLTTVYAPGHVAVAVYDENNVPWIVETTTTEMFVTVYDETDPEITKKWILLPEKDNNMIHLANWFRIFVDPFVDTKNDTLLASSMCHLHTIFEILQPIQFQSLALRVFCCFAGYVHGVVEQNLEEQQDMKTCFFKMNNELKDKPPLQTYFLDIFETQLKRYQDLQKKGNVPECKKTRTLTEQKKIQTFQRYYLMAPTYKTGEEKKVKAKDDDVWQVIEVFRSQNVLDSKKRYHKDILMTLVEQLTQDDTFSDFAPDHLRSLIVLKAIQLKKECMILKNCGDFPGESAVRLASAMLLYNPRIFLQGASAFMKYIEQNKISPESLKATSAWVSDIDILDYDKAAIEKRMAILDEKLSHLRLIKQQMEQVELEMNTLDRLYSLLDIEQNKISPESLKATSADKAAIEERMAMLDEKLSQLGLIDPQMEILELEMNTLEQLYSLLDNEETSHYFQN